MSEKKPSTLSGALSVTLVALGAVNLVLLAIFLMVSIVDVVGAGYDHFEHGNTNCYSYRSSISCVQQNKPAPLSTKVPNMQRPVWGVDQG